MTSWQIIKKSFKDFYDNMYFLFFINVIWFFICGPLIYLAIAGLQQGTIIWAILHCFIVGPLTAGVFYVINIITNDKNEQVSLSNVIEGIKLYYWRSVKAYFVSIFIAFILFIDYHFFVNSTNTVLRYLSGVWLYLLIFFAISQLYHWSLLVESREKYRVVLKDSMILVLKNIGYSLLIFMIVVILLALGIVSLGIVLATIFTSFAAILATNATLNLLVRHGVKDTWPKSY